MQGFDADQVLPLSLYRQVTAIRVSDPDRSLRAAQRRVRRPSLAPRGKLNIVASDHPARGVLAIGGDSMGMADRHDLLSRLLRVLSSNLVDGVMASMDVLEDLLVIHDLLIEQGGPAILDQKLLIASLNRGGLAGSIWEMDDPMTGPSPQTCANWKLDGAKILLRLCLNDSGSLKTLVAAAGAITQANALSLPIFLEALPVMKTENGFQIQKSSEPLAATVSIASALGDSSRFLWLKLPYCEEYEVVARATSLPILILGGESDGAPDTFLNQLASAMAAAPNVRGALVGRNALYPGNEDPLVVAEAIGAIVHKDSTTAAAPEAPATQPTAGARYS